MSVQTHMFFLLQDTKCFCFHSCFPKELRWMSISFWSVPILWLQTYMKNIALLWYFYGAFLKLESLSPKQFTIIAWKRNWCILQNSSFSAPQNKEVIQVWNSMRVNDWWQIFFFEWSISLSTLTSMCLVDQLQKLALISINQPASLLMAFIPLQLTCFQHVALVFCLVQCCSWLRRVFSHPCPVI